MVSRNLHLKQTHFNVKNYNLLTKIKLKFCQVFLHLFLHQLVSITFNEFSEILLILQFIVNDFL